MGTSMLKASCAVVLQAKPLVLEVLMAKQRHPRQCPTLQGGLAATLSARRSAEVRGLSGGGSEPHRTWGSSCQPAPLLGSEQETPGASGQTGLCQDTGLCPSVLKHGCAREGNFSLLGESALQGCAAEHKGLQSVPPLFVTCLLTHPAWLSPALLIAYPALGCQGPAEHTGNSPTAPHHASLSLPSCPSLRHLCTEAPTQLPPKVPGVFVPVQSRIELRP